MRAPSPALPLRLFGLGAVVLALALVLSSCGTRNGLGGYDEAQSPPIKTTCVDERPGLTVCASR